MKSNQSVDIAPNQRISDEDILNNINTFMFAGSDTSSLSLTWTLLLLAQNPGVQHRLRSELRTIASLSDNLRKGCSANKPVVELYRQKLTVLSKLAAVRI